MGNSSNPKRIERGFSEDHRGSIEYFNDVDLSKYKRFYIVSNPVQGTVRAWHGNQKEGKLIKVLEGVFLVGSVGIDNWDEPSENLKPDLFEIQKDSDLLYIPPGCANGAMNLVPESSIVYFSTSNLEESIEDDYRFDSKLWDPWTSRGGVIFE